MPGRAARLEVWVIALLATGLGGCIGEPPQGGDAPSATPAELFSQYRSCLTYMFDLRIDCRDVVTRTAEPGLPGEAWVCRATEESDGNGWSWAAYEHKSTGQLGVYVSDARGYNHQGRVNLSVDGANQTIDATFPGKGFLRTNLLFGRDFLIDISTNNLTVETNWPPLQNGSHRIVLLGGQPAPWYQAQVTSQNGTRYYFSPMMQFNGEFGPGDNVTFLGAKDSPYYVRVLWKGGIGMAGGARFDDELPPPLSEPCKPKY